ncbi:MAG: nitroreductase family protein [Acidobacteriaceae bacterium]|nr:nitroreductase family protein [Acidobacteriaceae bacterium]MBV8570575.1 nitroreductase family protein [Acidobacteriaceae bacterium]
MSAPTLEDWTVAKRAETVPGVHELVRLRWSPRSFSARSVTKDDLRILFDAARWAFSSYNEQPWRFIVARKEDGADFERLLNLLVPFNQGWAKTAPVLIITLAKKTFSNTGKPNFHALHDAGSALALLAVQATAMGLHIHGMAGFDRDRAHKELDVPDDYEVVTAVALGYLGSPESLPADLRERELAARQRKPLTELVFEGRWNHPLPL